MRETPNRPNLPDEGQYDVRRAATGYAQIVGIFGSLAVPAIVVLFTVRYSPVPGQSVTSNPEHGTLVSLAVALLVVGMLDSLFGAFGLAAIGAERDPTANLTPAIMFIGVPVSISIGSILGAFEVLADIYDNSTKIFFIGLLGVGGGFATFFLSSALSDSIGLGPLDPTSYSAWLRKQWLKDRKQARRWSIGLFVFTAVPSIATLILRWTLEWEVSPSIWLTYAILGAAGLVSAACMIYGQLRTSHVHDEQKSVTKAEGIISTGLVFTFFIALICFLP